MIPYHTTSPMLTTIRRCNSRQAVITFSVEILLPSIVLFAAVSFFIYVALYDAAGK